MRTAEIQKETNYMMCCQNCMCMMQMRTCFFCEIEESGECLI